MDKSTAMKSEVLEMLKQFMMGEHGKRMKPSAISVEVITPAKKGEKGLEEVLNRAAEDAPEVEEDELGKPTDVDGDGDHDEKDHMLAEEMEDDEDCGKKPRMSLQEFLSRK